MGLSDSLKLSSELTFGSIPFGTAREGGRDNAATVSSDARFGRLAGERSTVTRRAPPAALLPSIEVSVGPLVSAAFVFGES